MSNVVPLGCTSTLHRRESCMRAFSENEITAEDWCLWCVEAAKDLVREIYIRTPYRADSPRCEACGDRFLPPEDPRANTGSDERGEFVDNEGVHRIAHVGCGQAKEWRLA